MANEETIKKLARVLRTDHNVVGDICTKMEEKTGQKNIPEKIIEENEKLIERSLNTLGIKNDAHQHEIYDALLKKVKDDNDKLHEFLGRPEFTSYEGCKKFLEIAKELANPPKGFFLKKEKAIEFLKNQPPKKIMEDLGYSDVNELIEKEELYQIFAALRFIEDREWLNNVFFSQYNGLKTEDFEERDIELKVLDIKWVKTAEAFLRKKYHNISHLKELGVIFLIPLQFDVHGETMRSFALVLHYLHEVPFYSKLFKGYAKDQSTFDQNLISALRGDVPTKRLDGDDKANWMMVQRYLAKEDIYDWRLFEPHINPEALHWSKAARDIASLSEKHPELGLGFWKGLDHIGTFYNTHSGVEILVSFNLIDTVMELAMDRYMTKYLYHHQEALWNKIFSEYVGGEEKMEEIIIQNFTKGYIKF